MAVIEQRVMKHTRILLTITFIFVISTIAFGQRSPAGQAWTLTYLRGVNVGAADAFINIQPDGRRFTGNTGCNIMNGSVRLRGSSISFSAVITTKRACIRSTGPIEGSLLAALSRTTRYKAHRNKLSLYSGDRLLAEFTPRELPPIVDEPQRVGDQLSLEDRKWTLIRMGDTPVPKIEKEPFIVFDPVKKSAGGDTGCNVFGGSYETDGAGISFTETISTMRACIEDERMQVERKFLDGLRNANRYEIRADKLYLYRGKGLLLTFQGTKR